MDRDLDIMATIMEEREKELKTEELQPLNPEGETMAEHKRFTFDVITVPTDPLR